MEDPCLKCMDRYAECSDVKDKCCAIYLEYLEYLGYARLAAVREVVGLMHHYEQCFYPGGECTCGVKQALQALAAVWPEAVGGK